MPYMELKTKGDGRLYRGKQVVDKGSIMQFGSCSARVKSITELGIATVEVRDDGEYQYTVELITLVESHLRLNSREWRVVSSTQARCSIDDPIRTICKKAQEKYKTEVLIVRVRESVEEIQRALKRIGDHVKSLIQQGYAQKTSTHPGFQLVYMTKEDASVPVAVLLYGRHKDFSRDAIAVSLSKLMAV